VPLRGGSQREAGRPAGHPSRDSVLPSGWRISL
jgi:hypothetical protein